MRNTYVYSLLHPLTPTSLMVGFVQSAEPARQQQDKLSEPQMKLYVTITAVIVCTRTRILLLLSNHVYNPSITSPFYS